MDRNGIGLEEAIAALPLIAILRGVDPHEVEDIGAALVEAGFRIIEVPLNSPDPFRSIEILAARFGDRALIGGGTVMTADRARRVVRSRRPPCRHAAFRPGGDPRGQVRRRLVPAGRRHADGGFRRPNGRGRWPEAFSRGRHSARSREGVESRIPGRRAALPRWWHRAGDDGRSMSRPAPRDSASVPPSTNRGSQPRRLARRPRPSSPPGAPSGTDATRHRNVLGMRAGECREAFAPSMVPAGARQD